MGFSHSLYNHIRNELVKTAAPKKKERLGASLRSAAHSVNEYAAPIGGGLIGAGLGALQGYNQRLPWWQDLKSTITGDNSARIRNALVSAGIGAALGGLGGLNIKQHHDIGRLHKRVAKDTRAQSILQRQLLNAAQALKDNLAEGRAAYDAYLRERARNAQLTQYLMQQQAQGPQYY